MGLCGGKSLGGSGRETASCPFRWLFRAGLPLEACRQDLTSREIFPPNAHWVTSLYCPATSPGSLLPTDAVLSTGHEAVPNSATLISRQTLEQGSLMSRFLNTFCTITLPRSSEGLCGPLLPPLGSSSLGLSCDDASDLVAILWSPPGRGPITGTSTWMGVPIIYKHGVKARDV